MFACYVQRFFSVVEMAEGNCVGCDGITKYLCLKCGVFACNYTVDFEFQNSTDEGVHKQDETTDKEQQEQVMGTSDEHTLSIDCASRGFHEYRKIWSPKCGQKLTIKNFQPESYSRVLFFAQS